jgi:hypothetical protein
MLKSSILSIVLDYVSGAEESGLDSRQGKDIFLFFIAFTLSLTPTQPSIQWLLGAFSLGVK